MGEVALNGMALPANKDVMLSRSFELEHRRAGTVSLNLSHNMDESIYQQSGSYRNVSFLITTGQPICALVPHRPLLCMASNLGCRVYAL